MQGQKASGLRAAHRVCWRDRSRPLSLCRPPESARILSTAHVTSGALSFLELVSRPSGVDSNRDVRGAEYADSQLASFRSYCRAPACCPEFGDLEQWPQAVGGNGIPK